MDHLITEMKEVFNKDIMCISLVALLIPKVINENKDSESKYIKVLLISQR